MSNLGKSDKDHENEIHKYNTCIKSYDTIKEVFSVVHVLF